MRYCLFSIGCSIVLLVAFFLPWAQLFGFGASGFALGQLGSYGNLAWIIPIMSVIVFIFNLSQNDQRLIQVITGVVPWLGLFYGVSQVGKDLFHVLGIGAYLTLLAGLALVFAPAYPPKGHV